MQEQQEEDSTVPTAMEEVTAMTRSPSQRRESVLWSPDAAGPPVSPPSPVHPLGLKLAELGIPTQTEQEGARIEIQGMYVWGRVEDLYG